MIIGIGAKRRCPFCQSNKWVWLQAEPIQLDELLSKGLIAKYRCKNCGKEFLVEEGFKAKLAEELSRCIHCQSTRKLEKVSMPRADLDLYRCSQCGGYMGLKPKSRPGK